MKKPDKNRQSPTPRVDQLVMRHAEALVDQVMPLIRKILEQQMAAIVEEMREETRKYRKLEIGQCVLGDPHCECSIGEYCRRLPDA